MQEAHHLRISLHHHLLHSCKALAGSYCGLSVWCHRHLGGKMNHWIFVQTLIRTLLKSLTQQSKLRKNIQKRKYFCSLVTMAVQFQIVISLLCRPVLNTCVGVAARQYDIVPLITLSSDLHHRTSDLSSSSLILTPGLASSEYSKVCLLLRSLVRKQPKPPSVSLT